MLSDVRDRVERRRPPLRRRDPGACGARGDRGDVLGHARASRTRIGSSPRLRPLLFAAPIAVRRVWPGVALVFSLAAVTVSKPLGGELLSNDNAYVIPALVLSYSAGAWLRRGGAWSHLLWHWRCFGWALLPGPDGSTTGLGQATGRSSTSPCYCVPTWLVGRLVRRHNARASAFRELAAQAAADQDAHEPRRSLMSVLGSGRAPGHHRPQHQRDGDPGRERQTANAQRSRPGSRVDPERGGDRAPGAQRPAPTARDAAQGRRPARAQPPARASARSRR